MNSIVLICTLPIYTQPHIYTWLCFTCPYFFSYKVKFFGSFVHIYGFTVNRRNLFLSRILHCGTTVTLKEISCIYIAFMCLLVEM